MSYSGLTTYKAFTNNMSLGRGGKKVIRIAVHHMAGNLSVVQCGTVFKNNRVSAHYGVNGKQIGCYVDESNTAWALGNFDWNQRTINIEVANIKGAPNWEVSDESIETTINLIVDIAYRLGWTFIAYDGTLAGSDIIMHKWIASTACPGPYLSKKMPYIAREADRRLKEKRASKPSSEKKPYSGMLPNATIRRGSTGTNVLRWQNFLYWWYSGMHTSMNKGGSFCDGIFGAKTESFTKRFQAGRLIVPDGIVGAKTLAKAKAVKK